MRRRRHTIKFQSAEGQPSSLPSCVCRDRFGNGRLRCAAMSLPENHGVGPSPPAEKKLSICLQTHRQFLLASTEQVVIFRLCKVLHARGCSSQCAHASRCWSDCVAHRKGSRDATRKLDDAENAFGRTQQQCDTGALHL